MLFTVDNAADTLMNMGLLSVRAIIDGDLDVTSVTRRNPNVQVSTRDRGFFVKQPPGRDDLTLSRDREPGRAPERRDDRSTRTLRNEAEFYRFCEQESALQPLGDVLPRALYHDAEHAVLILELIRDAQPLWRHYKERSADDFPVDIARDVGHLLGAVHKCVSALHGELPGFLSGARPWALDLHRPSPDTLSRCSAAHHELVKLLQAQPSFIASMERIRHEWTPEHVIHGDVKMDNFLVKQKAAGEFALYLVDWELVQLGELAWDIAGALQDFVFWWVLSMPHHLAPEEMADQAGHPLPSLQPGIRAFWDGYRSARELSRGDAGTLLRRAVRLSAARMVQTAAEIASKYQTLPSIAILLAQIAVNVLDDPDAGLADLYSIEVSA